jgi:hypothetical protein
LPKIWRAVPHAAGKFGIRLELKEDSPDPKDWVDLPGECASLQEALDAIDDLKKAKVKKPDHP